MPKIYIGCVLIHHGMPPGNNPYRGLRRSSWHPNDPITTVGCGNERVEALRKFRDGEDTGDLTFWCDGGHGSSDKKGQQILSPDEIDWRHMS